MLADCVAIKVCKLHLYQNDTARALAFFRRHLKKFEELSRGWGIGEETFEFWSWVARQSVPCCAVHLSASVVRSRSSRLAPLALTLTDIASLPSFSSSDSRLGSCFPSRQHPGPHLLLSTSRQQTFSTRRSCSNIRASTLRRPRAARSGGRRRSRPLSTRRRTRRT